MSASPWNPDEGVDTLKARLVKMICNLPDKVIVDSLFGMPACFAPEHKKRKHLVMMVLDIPDQHLDELAALMLAFQGYLSGE